MQVGHPNQPSVRTVCYTKTSTSLGFCTHITLGVDTRLQHADMTGSTKCYVLSHRMSRKQQGLQNVWVRNRDRGVTAPCEAEASRHNPQSSGDWNMQSGCTLPHQQQLDPIGQSWDSRVPLRGRDSPHLAKYRKGGEYWGQPGRMYTNVPIKKDLSVAL